MKIFIAISLIYFTIGVNSTGFLKSYTVPQNFEQIIKLVTDKFPVYEIIGNALLNRGNLKQFENSRDPVIPVLPDPLPLPDPLNFTLNIDLIIGDVSLRTSIIEGLSTLLDDLKTAIALVPTPKVTVNYTLDITRFSFNGDYDADLIIDLISFGYPGSNVTGNGQFFINLTDIYFDLGLIAVLRPGSLTKIDIKDVSLNFGLENINLFFENMELYGEPIDYWNEINFGLKVILNYVWTTNRNDIEQIVTILLNDVVKDCTILQLIAIIQGTGDSSCLNLPTLPTPEPPTSDDPTNTPPTSDEPTNEPPTSYEPTSNPPASDEPTNTSPTSDEPTNKSPTSNDPTSTIPTNTEPTTSKGITNLNMSSNKMIIPIFIFFIHQIYY